MHELSEEGVTKQKPLQRSKDRVMVKFVSDLNESDREDRHPDHDEVSLVGYAGRNGQTVTVNHQAILPFFPQISIQDVILKSKIALWSDQGASAEAKVEVDRLSISISRAVGSLTRRPPVAR